MNWEFHWGQLRDIIKQRNFERASKYADAYLNFPRPSIEQHLSSEKAARKYLAAHAKSIFSAALCVCNVTMLWWAYRTLNLRLTSPYNSIFALLAVIAAAVAVYDYEKAWRKYRKRYRRESQGSAHWATPSDLKSRNMLFPRDAKVTPTHLPIAYLGTKYQIAIPIEQSREHMVYMGVQGSGKSASFFIKQARAYSDVGAGIFLDIKGEIYRHSAHEYDNVYRIDFEHPEFSDRIDLLSFCRPNKDHKGEDAKMAGEIASFMIGYDPNNPKGGENPFWPQSATSMLKCFLLFMAERFPGSNPADIFRLLAALAQKAELEAKKNPKTPPPHPIHTAFMNAQNPEIRAEWSPLATLDEKTLGNIVISMTTPIACFRDPAVQTVLSLPSNEERARGCRVIDFRDLRRKGTAIYVVVPEGQASRISAVVGTIFGVAMNVLRRSADCPGTCDTLVQLDEAGNVPLRNLREDIGVGRGRRITFSLGYQDKNQPQAQYGADYARSFLNTMGLKVLLPGAVGETAEWFSTMLDKTTTLKHSTNDAKADAFDSEKLDEIGRDLMDKGSLRQMERYKQCVLVINQAPPVLARMPDNAKAVDPTESAPQKFVWSEEDVRQAKQTELSRAQFFEHARKIPRLPLSVYDTTHAIKLSSSIAFDLDSKEWTTADVMMRNRQLEIKKHIESIDSFKSAMTAEEVANTRSQVSSALTAFYDVPTSVDSQPEGDVPRVTAAAASGLKETEEKSSDSGEAEPAGLTEESSPELTPTHRDAESTPQIIPTATNASNKKFVSPSERMQLGLGSSELPLDAEDVAEDFNAPPDHTMDVPV